MPWNEVLFPPMSGLFRAVSLWSGEFVAWTDFGLFLYVGGTYPSVKYVYPADRVASKVDRATGRVTWMQFQYDLVGDPEVVPAPSPGLLEVVGPDGQKLHLDRQERRLEVRCGDEVRFTAESFPPAGSRWFVATFAHDHLFLAHHGGVRLLKYVPTVAERRTNWDRSAVAGDHASLLAAILAQPDDDAVRRVYADFLEENGDPARAEFIRIQCDVAEKMRTAPVSPRGPKGRRAWELQRQHQSVWLDDLPSLRGVQWPSFWRGFPVPRVESTQTLIRVAEALAHLVPVQAAEVVVTSSNGLARLARSEVMTRLRVLELICYSISTPADWNDDLAAFGRSARVSGLRGFRCAGVNDAGAAALASSPHLTGLEWLDLNGTEMTDEGANALAASAQLPAVRWIDVSRQPLSDAVVARLKQRFKRVER